MPEICPRYARYMHKIHMPEIYPRYAQDMPKICPRYAQDMTTRKTVLTKRLPDKTSKAVLTKCLPDKTSADPKATIRLQKLEHFLEGLVFDLFFLQTICYQNVSLCISEWCYGLLLFTSDRRKDPKYQKKIPLPSSKRTLGVNISGLSLYLKAHCRPW